MYVPMYVCFSALFYRVCCTFIARRDQSQAHAKKNGNVEHIQISQNLKRHLKNRKQLVWSRIRRIPVRKQFLTQEFILRHMSIFHAPKLPNVFRF
jgi:hypothetical protein